MPKVTRMEPKHGEAYGFHCPGCKMYHVIPVSYSPERRKNWESITPGVKPPEWSFNGNPNRPTFHPSLLVREQTLDGKFVWTCHSFVRDGKIQFLTDSTHAKAGQTVDLPETEA